MMILALNIVSHVRPAAGGEYPLPRRISLQEGICNLPFATYLEALQSDGTWTRCHGHYFGSIGEVVLDYYERCETLGVTP